MTYVPNSQPSFPAPQQAAAYSTPTYYREPPKELTAFAVLAFSTAAIATLFTVASAALTGRALRNLDAGTLDWSVAAYGLTNVLALIGLVAGWVTASMWLYRARHNAELLNPSAHHARSAGWSWGGWICPIVAWWFPFQLVRDVSRALDPRGDGTTIGWWWAAFVAMLTGSRIVGSTTSNASIDDLSGIQAAEWVIALLTVAAMVLWGLVLRQVTREQHAAMLRGGPVS